MITDVLYCLSYRSSAPSIRPADEDTSPNLGSMPIMVNITGGISTARDPVIGNNDV